MEPSVVKHAPFTDTAAQSRGRDSIGSFGELSHTFTDLLRKAAFRVEGGLNALTDRAGLSRIVERRELEPTRETHEPARSDDGRDRPERARPSDERRDDRAETRRHERGDERPEHVPDTRRDRPEARSDERPASAPQQNSSAAPDESEHAANDDVADPEAGDGKGEAHGRRKSDGAEAKDHAGEKSRGAKSADGSTEAGAHQAAAKQVAETVIAGLLAGAHVKAQGESKAEAETPDASATSERAQRHEGLSSALAALAKQSGQSHRADGQRNGAEHAPAAEGDGAEEAATKFQFRTVLDRKSQQAAALAAKTGEDTHLQVKVSTGDEARTLISRPNAALAALVAGDGGDAKTQAGQGPAHGVPGAQAQTGAAVQAQATAAVAAASGQGQTGGNGAGGGNVTQAVAEAKGAAPVQAAPAGGGASAHAGGGETGTQGGAGGGNAAQNAPQSQPSQAHATQGPRHAQFRQQVLEQVQVHVAKAIQSGSDKITIQLKPAELGRIEVRMEVAQDGRTTVHVTADKQDTLDLLQRDSRDLARSLQDAGLRADAGSLSFGLREQQAKEHGKSKGGGARPTEGVEPTVADAPPADLDQGWGRPGRVDIRA